MSDIKLGNVPSSTLNDTSNFIFADGENVRKETYANVKADIVGSANLTTTAQKAKEAINELNQDLLESTGYGVISGGIVSAQSTPNMTVQVTQCTLKTSTGARQVATANASLAIAGADTTNPRIDIVYVDSTGAMQYLQGTAASSPTAPSTPSGGSLLAQISVAANASSITNSNIVDKRKMLISTEQLNSSLSEKANQSALNTTNTNVATNTTNITNHLADLVTDANGVHGLKIEEGTFTPVLNGGGGTYSVQVGFYKKIGSRIFYEINIHLTSKGALTDAIVITGLPFVPKNTTNRIFSTNIGWYSGVTTGTNSFVSYIESNYSRIALILIPSGGTGSYLSASNITDTFGIILQGSYEI